MPSSKSSKKQATLGIPGDLPSPKSQNTASQRFKIWVGGQFTSYNLFYTILFILLLVQILLATTILYLIIYQHWYNPSLPVKTSESLIATSMSLVELLCGMAIFFYLQLLLDLIEGVYSSILYMALFLALKWFIVLDFTKSIYDSHQCWSYKLEKDYISGITPWLTSNLGACRMFETVSLLSFIQFLGSMIIISLAPILSYCRTPQALRKYSEVARYVDVLSQLPEISKTIKGNKKEQDERR